MSLVRAAVAAVLLLSTSSLADSPRESKRISIDVVRADIHDVLRLLAEKGKLNVVVSDDVLGLRHAVDGTVDWSAVQLSA